MQFHPQVTEVCVWRGCGKWNNSIKPQEHKKNWERRGNWNSSWHLKCLFIMLGVKKKKMFFVLLTGTDISERFSFMFVKSFITKWVSHDKEVCVAQILLCLFVQEDCANFTFLKQFLLPPILFYVCTPQESWWVSCVNKACWIRKEVLVSANFSKWNVLSDAFA